MKDFKRRKTKNGLTRAVVFALAILLQFVWIFISIILLRRHFQFLSIVASVIAPIVSLYLFGKDMNSAFKFPWLILILVFPLTGLTLYFLTGHSSINKRQIRRFVTVADWIRDIGERNSLHDSFDENIDSDSKENSDNNQQGENNVAVANISLVNQSRYISSIAHYPPYFDSDVTYFSDAKTCFEDIIKEVKKAKKFIFMEYHAIEKCAYFEKLVGILRDKVKEGVEVRLIYDELGSVFFVSNSFANELLNKGIKCRIFNPISPTINILMNNRDHRKITVIDGKVGYTGGFNLADEYFNIVNPYGYWKDTGVRIKGNAVTNFTTIFLEMWNQINCDDNEADIVDFICSGADSDKSGGGTASTNSEMALIQPFADTPLDNENVGENIYLNAIFASKKYIWISTPYLIIDDETVKALILAAGRGVDVRIVIPGIPDKKIVYQSTKSYASLLAQNGVVIYRYTPGFNHAKQLLCDDELAICGTVNFDYRSFFFHFEDGVLFTNKGALNDMKTDFENIFEQSENSTVQMANRLKRRNLLYDNILRLISPLF